MADFDSVRQTIDASIRQNGTGAITGPVLNGVLNEMVDAADDQVSQLSLEVDNIIGADGTIVRGYGIINNSYVDARTGAFSPYNGWSRTDYIPIDNYSIIEIVGFNTTYNWFYDENKQPLNVINLAFGRVLELSRWPNARYIVLSESDANMANLVITAYGYKNTNLTNLEKQISGIEDYADGLSLGDAEILLPSKIALMTGKEFLVQFQNVLYGFDAKKVNARCVREAPFYPFPEWMRAKPSVAGTNYGTLRLYCNPTLDAIQNDSGVSISRNYQSVTIDASTAGQGVTKRVLVIGDSITAPGSYIRIARQLFADDVMNVQFIGTMGYGAIHIDGAGAIVNANGVVLTNNWRYTDNWEVYDITTGQILKDASGENMTLNHEGHGGWSAETFLTQQNYGGYFNAFYNPSTSAFDFSYYMSHYGFDTVGVDYVFINLGINDVAKYSPATLTDSALNTIIANYDQIISSIKAYNANAKICIGLPIMPGENDYTNEDVVVIRIMRQLLWRKIINNYDGASAQNLYVFPMGFPVDSKRDFATSEQPICDRNPELVAKIIDTTHPNTTIAAGKIADVLQTYIKYLATL